MFFIFLVFLSAFLIEGIGTYVSVVGLSALFASNPIIIILAVALDLGKVVGVSFLYKYAKKLNIIMRSYMTIAAIVLMMITSTGAFGYLSAQFQKAVQGTNQDTIMVQSLEKEQTRLQHRKEEIDTQIAKLPDNSVNGRRKLIKSFAQEQDKINSRLEGIDKQLPELKVASVKKDTEVGPIIYVAKAFNTDPEHAVKWVILIIIFVFDPLAITLLLAGNFLVDEREKKKQLALEKFTGTASPINKEAQAVMQYGFDAKDFEDEAHATTELPEPTSYPPMPAIPPPKQEPILEADSPSVIGPPAPLPTLNELHEALGRERYVEPLIDQLDHITHEDLGRQKPDYTNTPEPEDFTQPVMFEAPPVEEMVTSARVLPSSKPREIITKDQIIKPVAKSQLENQAVRDQGVDIGLGVKVR